jgi:hypothetical protein
MKNAKKGISALLSLYKPRVRVKKGNKSGFPVFGKNRFSYGGKCKMVDGGNWVRAAARRGFYSQRRTMARQSPQPY